MPVVNMYLNEMHTDRARARVLIKFAFKMRSSFYDAACFIPHDFHPDESGLAKSGKQGEGRKKRRK